MVFALYGENNYREGLMKLFKILLISSMTLVMISSLAIARDFDWTRQLNVQAQADPSGFRAELATRFKIGDAHFTARLSSFDNPADAYIILRLGEMSNKPLDYVIEKYEQNMEKGWGALAKSLGIKPGSDEFHALKRGHDLYSRSKHRQVQTSDYGRGDPGYVANDHGQRSAKGKGKK